MDSNDIGWAVGGTLGGLGLIVGALYWKRLHSTPTRYENIAPGPSGGTRYVNITGSSSGGSGSGSSVSTTEAPQLVINSISVQGVG